VILPAENEKDMADIPAKIRKSLKILFVRHMDEVIDAAIDMSGAEKPVEPVTPPEPEPEPSAAPPGSSGEEVIRH
jgi:ATP-dependent Lon protease